MLENYAIGLFIPAALAVAWVCVQTAWARAFPEPGGDPDPLARRMDCNGCGCSTICQRRLRGQVSEETVR